MIRQQTKALFGYQVRLTSWAGEVRRSLDRELRALQVSHQDAAFLATVKGDAYQHLVVRNQVAISA